MFVIKHPATTIPLDRLNVLSGGWPRNSVFIVARAKLLSQTILNYYPQALLNVNIGFGGVGVGHKQFTQDGEQAFLNALSYLVTRNETYANQVQKILDAWSTTCKVFTGNNAPLEAAWGTASMARACELMKWTYHKWDVSVEKRYIAWVDKLLMPHLKGVTERYNLEWGYYNNWHSSILEARLQFALLTNDFSERSLCIEKYKVLVDKGIASDYTVHDGFRDSTHTEFFIAGMVQIPEILFNQGVNMYTEKLFKMINMYANVYFNSKVPSTMKLTSFPNISNYHEPCGWEIISVRSGNLYKDVLKKMRPFRYTFHFGCDTLTHANFGGL